MLVLSRQRDETIMIGDDIEITIVDIRGDKVRLGITAPATIPVHRKEVYDAIQRENREASRMKMEDLGSLPKAGRPSVPPGLHRPASVPVMPKPGSGPSPGSGGGGAPGARPGGNGGANGSAMGGSPAKPSSPPPAATSVPPATSDNSAGTMTA
jgi:carbon storage regulator